MDFLGDWLNLTDGDWLTLRNYGSAVAITLLLCALSRSRILAFSGAIVALGWIVSTGIFFLLRYNSGPFFAFQGSVMALLFYSLWKRSAPQNKALFQRLYFIHLIYAAAAGYRFFGESFFADTLSATYYFQQTIQNGAFILTLLMLSGFSAFRISRTWKAWAPRPRRDADLERRPPYSEWVEWAIHWLFVKIHNDDLPQAERIASPPAPARRSQIKGTVEE